MQSKQESRCTPSPHGSGSEDIVCIRIAPDGRFTLERREPSAEILAESIQESCFTRMKLVQGTVPDTGEPVWIFVNVAKSLGRFEKNSIFFEWKPGGQYSGVPVGDFLVVGRSKSSSFADAPSLEDPVPSHNSRAYYEPHMRFDEGDAQLCTPYGLCSPS